MIIGNKRPHGTTHVLLTTRACPAHASRKSVTSQPVIVFERCCIFTATFDLHNQDIFLHNQDIARYFVTVTSPLPRAQHPGQLTLFQLLIKLYIALAYPVTGCLGLCCACAGSLVEFKQDGSASSVRVHQAAPAASFPAFTSRYQCSAQRTAAGGVLFSRLSSQ
jgi:hypothetical protein